jgi:hypothetical protein
VTAKKGNTVELPPAELNGAAPKMAQSEREARILAEMRRQQIDALQLDVARLIGRVQELEEFIQENSDKLGSPGE